MLHSTSIPFKKKNGVEVQHALVFHSCTAFCLSVHDQLNAATHRTLHETSGVANMKIFEHLGLLARTGYMLDDQGHNRYLPRIERLKFPITFLQGAENETFLAESTERTFAVLRDAHGKGLYHRHVIPDYGHID